MTIVELSYRLDVDYSLISRIKRGPVNPATSIVLDIVAALQLSRGAAFRRIVSNLKKKAGRLAGSSLL